jgi:uncharacterized protein (DUF2147 family)
LLSLVQLGRAALQEKIKIWKSIQTMAAKWKQDRSMELEPCGPKFCIHFNGGTLKNHLHNNQQ